VNFLSGKNGSSTPRVIGRRRPDLVALGGTNTALTHLPPRSPARWPDVVGRQLALSVLNLGRDGATIRDAYDRGLVDRALSSGARFVIAGFAVDDSRCLEVTEFSGLLHRLLCEAESTATTPLLLTGVWLDPTRVLTNAVNEKLQPFNEAIRSAAADRGVRLVDVAARMERATSNGHWDLRTRKGATDNRQGAGRRMRPRRWHDEHLDEAGSRLVAHLVVQTLRGTVRIAH
jgi:hypothetical protein